MRISRLVIGSVPLFCEPAGPVQLIRRPCRGAVSPSALQRLGVSAQELPEPLSTSRYKPVELPTVYSQGVTIDPGRQIRYQEQSSKSDIARMAQALGRVCQKRALDP